MNMLSVPLAISKFRHLQRWNTPSNLMSLKMITKAWYKLISLNFLELGCTNRNNTQSHGFSTTTAYCFWTIVVSLFYLLLLLHQINRLRTTLGGIESQKIKVALYLNIALCHQKLEDHFNAKIAVSSSCIYLIAEIKILIVFIYF